MKILEITPEIVYRIFEDIKDLIPDNGKEYVVSNEYCIYVLEWNNKKIDVLVSFRVKIDTIIITNAYCETPMEGRNIIEYLDIEFIKLFDEDGEEVDFICDYEECENFVKMLLAR